MGFQNATPKLIRFTAAGMLVAAMAAVHSFMPATSRSGRGEAFIPRPATAKWAALGFDAVLADFYWLWAVQIVGGSNADRQGMLAPEHTDQLVLGGVPAYGLGHARGHGIGAAGMRLELRGGVDA